MSICKISITLIVLALMVFTCQVSAIGDQGGKSTQEGTTVLAAKSPVDTSDIPVDVDEQPEIIKAVQPKYPEAARIAKLEGTVRLKLLVNKLGIVDTVIVQQPTPAMAEMERAAVEAAKQWVFKPAKQEGKPSTVWVAIPVKFKLSEGKK